MSLLIRVILTKETNPKAAKAKYGSTLIAGGDFVGWGIKAYFSLVREGGNEGEGVAFRLISTPLIEACLVNWISFCQPPSLKFIFVY